MSGDVELLRQRMLQAQTALLNYARLPNHDPNTHKRLVEELQKATRDFLDSIERLTRNPPSRLVGD